MRKVLNLLSLLWWRRRESNPKPIKPVLSFKASDPALTRIKTFLLALLLVVMLSGCTSIKNNIRSWNTADTAYQTTYLALTTIDWAQTHWMAKNDWKWNGKEYREFCPLLGTKPHQDKVDILIPVGMVLHTGIALVLTPKYKILGFEINPRRIWQMTWILIEAGAVGNNMGAGVRIEF